MVILYFVRWFNIILFLRFLFQPGRLCTKLGFFVYYYLPYCYLHQTQENENVRTIKEGKIILKIALRIWSYVLDFLLSNPIVWSYIFRRIFFFYFLIILPCWPGWRAGVPECQVPAWWWKMMMIDSQKCIFLKIKISLFSSDAFFL